MAERYEFAPDLELEDGGLVSGTCFRRVSIRAASPIRSLQLFLSPDQRFLFEMLLDTTDSPAAERRRVARETQLALIADNSPSKGSEKAPITLVEFSDFQCPYCKRFSELLEQLPPEDLRLIDVVFKHRPLAMHKWARRAALTSICASFQSAAAFWKVEEFLFANQENITATDLDERVAQFAKGSGSIDLGALRAQRGQTHFQARASKKMRLSPLAEAGEHADLFALF